MFSYAIGIDPADIDHMGHVNNSVYLRWVQEAVTRYWEKVAPAEAVAAHLWVALKHEITYRKPALLDDSVVADVIAEQMQGARFLQHRDPPRRGHRRRGAQHLVLPRFGIEAAGAPGPRRGREVPRWLIAARRRNSRNRKGWSGRQDSNLRPSAPKADALPGCATPRQEPWPKWYFGPVKVERGNASSSIEVPLRSKPLVGPEGFEPPT